MMIGTALRRLCASIGVLWLVGAAARGHYYSPRSRPIGHHRQRAVRRADLGLLLLAVQTFRAARWALVIDLVLLAGFVIVVGGWLWELGHVDPRKAAQLRAIGFDPSFAVGFQLGYSVAGGALKVPCPISRSRPANAAATS